MKVFIYEKLLIFPKDSQRNGKSSGWHLLGPEFDSQWERIFEPWVKKNPIDVPHPLSGYVSCSPPSDWDVAKWTVLAGPLVMGGQGSGIFSACVSRSSTSNATPQGVVFPLAGRFLKITSRLF
jgi:hypothetical protein